MAARDSQGRALDTSQPIRIDDQGTLESLQRELPDGLLQATSLFQIARAAGHRTAVVGRTGPASLFDIERQGWVLNDNYVFPREFALEVASLDLGLPADASALLPDLVAGSAYRATSEFDLYGGVFSLVTASTGATWQPYPNPNAVINPLVPELHRYRSARELEVSAAHRVITAGSASLLVVWLRDPAETALRVGPSAEAASDAITNMDAAVGELWRALPEGSNLLVTSDGGVTALAGDERFFPRWGLGAGNGAVAFLPSRKAAPPAGVLRVDTPGGIPTDGAVRLVDLLSRSGFLAYDGESCLSGHAYSTYDEWKKDWKYDSKDVCPDGAITGPALVPPVLDPRAIVVASNGASELIHLPSHRKGEMEKLVAFLQSRPEIGAIFVAPRYLKEGSELPGTLSLELLGFPQQTLLDLLVTYAWDGEDPVAFGPLMQPNPPAKPRLGDLCAEATPCRGGLFCAASTGKCSFCPSGRDRLVAACNVDQSELEAAQAASTYQREGQPCEEWAVCAPGLTCNYGVCSQLGEPPSWIVTEPPARHLLGSSYGAMGGVQFAYKLGSAGGSANVLRDDYFGVRGGASRPELSAFLIAAGPAFKREAVIESPSGVVDLAPTLLHVLQPGLERKLGRVDGRVLEEALADGPGAPEAEPLVEPSSTEEVPLYSPSQADSNASTLLSATGTYRSRLEGYSLDGGNTFTYFTLAAAEREGLTCDTSADCPDGVACGAKDVCLVRPSCVDGIKNGAEVDVDCGSDAKCRLCYVGQACSKAADCDSRLCVDGICVAP